MNKIILFIVLIFSTSFSFAQKDILHYFNKVYPRGFITEFTITDTILDQKNKFLEFSYQDSTYKKILLQIKIYPSKKQNDLLLVSGWNSDMQCEWNYLLIYEIDADSDSLIAFSTEYLIHPNGFAEFCDTSSILKNIYPKYSETLREYLGENDPKFIFLVELYDIAIELNQYNDNIKSFLILCDYMPTNIVGFAEEDWEQLRKTKTIIKKFNRKKRVFE